MVEPGSDRKISKYKEKRQGSEKALPLLDVGFSQRGKPGVSPPLPAQTTNLFDAACALPGLEKPGEVI
jgi:hypothetical protein